MLAFGITAKVDKQAVVNIFSTVLPSSSHEDLQKIGVDISEITVSSANFMIALGVITVVIAIFGFVGACCLIQWMLVVVSNITTDITNKKDGDNRIMYSYNCSVTLL